MGGGILKLNNLWLVNYRGIKKILLETNGENIVFYGVNGVGKSSILKAITYLFSDIITKVSEKQIKQQIKIERDDVMFGASEMKIYGKFMFDNGKDCNYGFSWRRAAGAKRLRDDDVPNFLSVFSELYMNDGDALPIFSYYNVNRSVLDVPIRIRIKHDFGRIAAYQNSMGKTDFRTFFEWFRNQEDIENQEKVMRKDLEYTDTALNAVRTAISAMMPELSDIRIVRNPLRMCATKNKKTLRVEQLSDGEKCSLAMVGDIARRLAIANPHSKDPLLGGGIVLIDEVDLHLHPRWQREIASILHKTFPNIQFILTTHSPLVLGGLSEDFKIFELVNDEDCDEDCIAREMKPAYYDVNMVLKDKMGTPYISPEVDQAERRIFECIKVSDIDAAMREIEILKDMTNNTHPSITKAQMLIRRQSRKG